MNNLALAQSYLVKAQKRLKILDVLLAEEAYSDVIREAQEIVELALKGILRQVGIEPPKWHDVGTLILEYQNRFPDSVKELTTRLAEISSIAHYLSLMFDENLRLRLRPSSQIHRPDSPRAARFVAPAYPAP
ncbi:MAG: hypothetical protein C0393_02780 [Anaerolinea sp.]|nr:hypothetical protein [Anaerolinea sp.]